MPRQRMEQISSSSDVETYIVYKYSSNILILIRSPAACRNSSNIFPYGRIIRFGGKNGFSIRTQSGQTIRTRKIRSTKKPTRCVPNDGERKSETFTQSTHTYKHLGRSTLNVTLRTRNSRIHTHTDLHVRRSIWEAQRPQVFRSVLCGSSCGNAPENSTTTMHSRWRTCP